MHKRFLLLLFTLILSVPLFAQLEVKEGSFKKVEGFVNINTEKMYDDNDKPYAVLKIRTENIGSKERRELNFGGDAQTFFEIEYKDGEVWLYISYYASFIKISHEEFSSAEFYFPFDMEPKKGYELTLINKSNHAINGWGSITIKTIPENGANISLNGKVLNETTPYSNNMISSGKYEISVSKNRYKTVTQFVDIYDGDNKTIEIELPSDVAIITLIADAQTEIYMNGIYKKNGTWRGELSSGNYDIVYKKQYHNEVMQTIIVKGGCPETYELRPVPIYGEINVDSKPSGATIYIDGDEYGITPMKIENVIIGPHVLSLNKNGYGFLSQHFTMEEGNPINICDSLLNGLDVYITTDGKKDKIYVDDVFIGNGPIGTYVSFGVHKITAIRNEKTINRTIIFSTKETYAEVKIKFIEGIINDVFFRFIQ